jgi:hypothetical protein
VSAVRVKGPASDKVEKTTVQDRLRSLGARCQDGELVDSAGKEICFFRLVGCWGNPPFKYRDILRRQNEELSKLREHCTVIEITCNPSGLPPEDRVDLVDIAPLSSLQSWELDAAAP